VTAPTGPEVIVVGAGGHARVAIEVLRANGFAVTGCLSREGAPTLALDVPVLGCDTELAAYIGRGRRRVFIGVGDNAARLELARQVRAAGGELVTVVSEHAIVSPSAVVGAGTLVMPGAVVNAGAVLGDVVIVNTNASVDYDSIVRDGAHIAPGVAIAGGVTIGECALLGIGSCVVPGVTVGAGAIVGAGAAVVRDEPNGATVVGVPARSPRRV
jgi:UDP-perosamine 4-acetyltransferase